MLGKNYYSIILLMILIICNISYCVPPDKSADVSFKEGDYNQYLQCLLTDTAYYCTQPQNNILYGARTAIALEKTALWKEDVGQQVDNAVAAYPNVYRSMHFCKALIDGEPGDLYNSPLALMLASPTLRQVVDMLHASSYHDAANMLNALRLTKRADIQYINGEITSWLSLPPGKKTVIDEAINQYLAMSSFNRQAIADAAFNYILHTKPESIAKDDPPWKSYFDLALQVGKGTPSINLRNAESLFYQRYNAEAIQLALQVAEEHPESVTVQLSVGSFFTEPVRDISDALLTYKSALRTVPEPFTRALRLAYLITANHSPAPDANAFIEQTGRADALFQADRLFIAGDTTRAGELYYKAYHNSTLPLEMRIAAWCGMFDTREDALTQAAPLWKELAQQPAATRGRLVSWLGWTLWGAGRKAVGRQAEHRLFVGEEVAHPCMMTTGWAQQTAGLMDALFTMDSLACLRPSSAHDMYSLRLPAAMLYCLAGQMDHACAVLFQQATDTFQPPPGGWMIDGFQTNNANTPHTTSYPYNGESMRLAQDLLNQAMLAPISRNMYPQLVTAMLHACVAQLPKITKAEERQKYYLTMAMAISNDILVIHPLPTGMRLDQPAPPPSTYNHAAFNTLCADFRDLRQQQEVQPGLSVLILHGLGGAMCKSSNPEVLDALYKLTVETQKLYQTTAKSTDEFTLEVTILAECLDNVEVYNLHDYATRLRNEFHVVKKP